MKTIEMCAGAGGQAIGLHSAGFKHEALIEIDENAHKTLIYNNRNHNLGWKDIILGDLKDFAEQRARNYRGKITLVAGGVPCPPFSKASKQLGASDDRDLFPTALKVVSEIDPLMVMLENVPGLAESKFSDYRKDIIRNLRSLGYECDWRVLQANFFGVPQLRPRVIFVAIKKEFFHLFQWPEGDDSSAPTVGEALYKMMAQKGWCGVDEWKRKANKIAPTLVGGSKKHGGPDLGPSRAKKQWQELGVNGHRLAGNDEIPGPDFVGALLRDGSIRPGTENMPLLTVPMAARIQGFPQYWQFVGSKTHAYRQVGNAFPPPVAQAVGEQLMKVCLKIHQIINKEVAA